jgi:ketosteroid isomerase-like protein
MLAALVLAAALTPFDQVVAAERAFAAASREKGLHAAFLANLAEDSISFAPLPSPARAAHTGQPPSRRTLNWGPGWVAVSAAGDMALSIGPWEFLDPDKPGPKTGWFVSVWRRQSGGAWKVAVDAGVSVSMPFVIPESVQNGFTGTPPKAPRASDAASARLAITAAERTFESGAKSGFGAAATAQADPLLRVYREQHPAAEGLEAARAALAADTRKGTCVPDRVVTSSSGDLGYAYGSCTGIDANLGSKYGFLHVWRKGPDESWKLVVDVTP